MICLEKQILSNNLACFNIYIFFQSKYFSLIKITCFYCGIEASVLLELDYMLQSK